MTRRATLSAIRFGTGLAPGEAPPDGAEALLAGLGAPDTAARHFPQEGYAARAARTVELFHARRDRAEGEAAEARYRRLRREIREEIAGQLGIELARGIAGTGFRERLSWFWADHFTVSGNRRTMLGSLAAYVEEAIRPHLAGRFTDLLQAAILHPVMLLYLDQDRSIGPNSVIAGRRGAGGLNENLAREVLELHSLGSGYTQRDVREFAELLTGVTVRREGAFLFHANLAEPGAEEILGRVYGGAGPAELSDIRRALRDLALRPETARHLSAKLAAHFVADTPDPAMVEAMQAAYLDSGSDLAATYAAMLAHPSAWDDTLSKVKRPLHFVVSALRALGLPPETASQAAPRDIRRFAYAPLVSMGQRWQGAPDPAGFPDTEEAWLRPQMLAARIGWAMLAPAALDRRLPDPRAFVDQALGDAAGPDLRWAAARAETRAEGVGLVLASPDFQRS